MASKRAAKKHETELAAIYAELAALGYSSQDLLQAYNHLRDRMWTIALEAVEGTDEEPYVYDWRDFSVVIDVDGHDDEGGWIEHHLPLLKLACRWWALGA